MLPNKYFTIYSLCWLGNMLRYTRQMLRSGLIRQALTETNTPFIALVCSMKISLSSFCISREILFCLVVSIFFILFFADEGQPVT